MATTTQKITALQAENILSITEQIRAIKYALSYPKPGDPNREVLIAQSKLLRKRLEICLNKFPQSIPLYEHLKHLKDTNLLH